MMKLFEQLTIIDSFHDGIIEQIIKNNGDILLTIEIQ